MLAATLDPDGRRVELSEERWRHIIERHPRLAPYIRSIMAAVREPDRRVAGRDANEEWFLLSDAGPSQWLQVVVHYEGGDGWIVTAFARRMPPKQ